MVSAMATKYSGFVSLRRNAVPASFLVAGPGCSGTGIIAYQHTMSSLQRERNGAAGGPSYREAKGGDVAEPKLHSRAFFLSSIITLRRARLIRVWYPRPARWNHASTSASSRNVAGFFSGFYIPPHSPRRYLGSLLAPAEASIFITFRRALARFVTRFRGSI